MVIFYVTSGASLLLSGVSRYSWSGRTQVAKKGKKGKKKR